ncbi:MAG: hypothetical protein Q9182_000533 [Xanthomendoza sp. 2 TL-2023]
MPIFEDPEQRFFAADQTSESLQLKTVRPRVAGGGIGIGFCDGPLSDSPSWEDVSKNNVGQKSERKSERPSHSRGGVCTSNRNELIERLKRGESATWVPSQTLQDEYLKTHHDNTFSLPSGDTIQRPTPLLPSADLQEKSSTANDPYGAELSPPSGIKRPRSALHAGDFTKGSHNAAPTTEQSTSPMKLAALAAPDIIGASPTTRWYIPFQPLQNSHVVPPFPEKIASQRPGPIPSRSRAPSSGSLSSSYVAKAPTTPLVQQSNNTDLDFSPIDRSISPGKTSRRHTLPPRPLPCGQEQPTDGQLANHASAARRPPVLRNDPPLSYQTHRPRRSLTTTWSLQASPSSEKPPSAPSRRRSCSSESSPLQHASMVGSYEESILRGWMSTAPSRPLNFTAQIGVIGKDGCKPKCPAHVTLPFPAVFYSWNGGTGTEHSTADDEPSPYVGHIDLSQLPAPAESKKTRQSRSKSPSADAARSVHMQSHKIVESGHDTGRTAVGQNKRRRTSSAPSTLQGGYRIPQKGQLQIVIQNPNKTAVKLFLVPYNLEDMQTGTKTFIRQRCFSTNPVIEGLPSERKSESGPSLGGTPIKKKPTLRYLIHVNICSPLSGRFYLYQHIRVVFANRVPDNQEQLQTEIQIPQPRYSTYKSSLALSRSLSSSGAGFSRGKTYRSLSSGFGVGLEGIDDRHPQALGSGTNYPFAFDSPPPPIPRIPYQMPSTQAPDHIPHFRMDVDYHNSNDRSAGRGEDSPFPISGGSPASPTPAFPFTRLSTDRQRPRRNGTKNQRPAEDEVMDLDNISRPTTASSQNLQSPLRDETNRRHLKSKRSDLSHSSGENGAFGKLSRGDVGYGGRPATPEMGVGLLARKLRGLGMEREGNDVRESESSE